MFYFDCEHILVVYIVKKTKETKNFADLKNNRGILKIFKNRILL